jgi:hypothetical protein
MGLEQADICVCATKTTSPKKHLTNAIDPHMLHALFYYEHDIKNIIFLQVKNKPNDSCVHSHATVLATTVARYMHVCI